MKTNRTMRAAAVAVGAMLLLALAASAQVPTIMSYQGRVTVGGINYTGPGEFKFALVNAAGNATYWSNDGTSAAGSEPTAAVEVDAEDGLFTVFLGDTALPNMTAVDVAAFQNNNVHLRIWFREGATPFEQLAPDQPVGSVGYAMMSAQVANNAIGANQLAAGAVTVDKLSINSVSADKIVNSTITSNKIDWSTMPDTRLKSYAENGAYEIAPVATGDNATAIGYGAHADGAGSMVAGGSQNISMGDYSTAVGGAENTAAANYSFVAGYRAAATNIGAFVWADSTGEGAISTADNQVTFSAEGGFRHVEGTNEFLIRGGVVTINDEPLGGTNVADMVARTGVNSNAAEIAMLYDEKLTWSDVPVMASVHVWVDENTNYHARSADGELNVQSESFSAIMNRLLIADYKGAIIEIGPSKISTRHYPIFGIDAPIITSGEPFSGFTIRGRGNYGTTIGPVDGYAGPMFVLTNLTGILRIENIRFQAGVAGNSENTNIVLDVRNVCEIQIAGCEFDRFRGTAIRYEPSVTPALGAWNAIHRTWFVAQRGSEAHPTVHLVGSRETIASLDFLISECYFYTGASATGSKCVLVDGGFDNVRIVDNLFYIANTANGAAIELTWGRGATIVGNNFDVFWGPSRGVIFNPGDPHTFHSVVVGNSFGRSYSTNLVVATPSVRGVTIMANSLGNGSMNIAPDAGVKLDFTKTDADLLYQPIGDYVTTSALSAYVPASRTVTINGITQSLNDDLNFTILAEDGSQSEMSIPPKTRTLDFQPLDPGSMLNNIGPLPCISLTCMAQGTLFSHFDHMIQECDTRVGVGETDTSNSDIDTDGVALAAIQGGNRKLEAEVAGLKARIDRLEALIAGVE